MPNLKIFARRIQALSNRIEKNINTTVRKTAIVASQTVIHATPVDTGRARGNWFVGVGAPIRDESDDTDQSGTNRINANNSKINTRKSRQTIFISNNLPYIQKLNEGSSSQAPANFVEQAVQIAANFIRRSKVVK